MKPFLALALAPVALLLLSPAASAGTAPGTDQRYVFDVSREGRSIGTHEVRLQRDGDITRAIIDTRLRVSVLGFTVYHLDYESEEVWTRNRLQSLRVEVNDNGERLTLEGRRRDDAFVVTGDGERRLALPLVPTNHWHPIILEQDRVLNTLTGKINDITVHRLGRDALKLSSTTVDANRYRFTGDLRLHTWYDDGGRWLAMDFEARDGSVIEYRCRNCTGQDGYSHDG